MEQLLSTDVGFARVLLWIRYPHLNPPHCLSHLDFPSIESRLDYVISCFIDLLAESTNRGEVR